jgi:hypothetical protein
LRHEALPFCGAILSNTLRPSTIGASAFRSGPRRAKKGENENACFASRNERLRTAGRKPLISLRDLNQAFLGIVCFQGFISFRRFLARVFSGPKVQAKPDQRVGGLEPHAVQTE